jgi:hypothetical protein
MLVTLDVPVLSLTAIQNDPVCEAAILVDDLGAPRQWIGITVIKCLHLSAIEPRFIHFQNGTAKQGAREFLDGKTQSFGSGLEAPVTVAACSLSAPARIEARALVIIEPGLAAERDGHWFG